MFLKQLIVCFSDMQMFDRVRGQDINILKMFGVKYIVDLMVEKKKVKFGMKYYQHFEFSINALINIMKVRLGTF